MYFKELKALLDLYDKFKQFLEKPIGLIIFSAVIFTAFYKGFPYLPSEIKDSPTLIALICAILFLVAIAIWVIYRNYTPIRNHFSSDKILFGVAYIIDRDENKSEIEIFVKSIVDSLRSKNGLSSCEFHIINKKYSSLEEIKNDTEKEWIDYKTVIAMDISIGNVDSEKTFVINNTTIFYSGYDQIVFDEGILSLSNEVKFASDGRIWSYTDSNSLLGRRHLSENIKEVLIYFIGTYLLCNRLIKESIEVFGEIFKNEDTKILAQIDPTNGKISFKINQQNIIASRIALWFEKAYITLALYYYSNNQKEEALRQLLLFEETIGHSALLYKAYISIARIFYDKGSLEKAKVYTLKARSIFNKDTQEVCLNKGFFAILDNNPKELYENYKNIKGDVLISISDVLAFLDNESAKFPEKKLLFDYAVGYLNFWYSDFEMGVQILENFVVLTVDDVSLKKLRNGAKNTLNKKEKRRKEYEKQSV